MKRIVLVVGLMCVPAAQALAQEMVTKEPSPRASFSAETFWPAPGPGAFFQVESGDIAPHLSTSLGVAMSLSRRPLVMRETLMGETLSEPISLRIGSELMAAIGLFGRVHLGFAMPVVVYQEGDRYQGLDYSNERDERGLGIHTYGDLRLYGKVSLLPARHGYGLSVATDAIATVPTGDKEQFAGEAGFVFEPRGIVAYRSRWFSTAVNFGYRYRMEKLKNFARSAGNLPDELTWGVAGAAPIPGLGEHDVTALAEVVWMQRDQREGSAGEGRLGARYRVLGVWSVAATFGLGAGDARAVAVPEYRGGLDFRYDPAPQTDADQDGIVDVFDACPTDPEDRDGTKDRDGCVDPDDDGDGVPDVQDRCPAELEDRDQYADSDGCPDPDNDHDGVADDQDLCPDDAEDKDGFQDQDGCFDRNNDGDRLVDDKDACPDAAEDRDGFEDEDGCPDLDHDKDGVVDDTDRCLGDMEDRDGWQDEDGCSDPDDDRDGVPDGLDRCLDAPETLTSPADVEADGCPDGVPMARPAADGSVVILPQAEKALVWKPGEVTLSHDAALVVDAVSRAALRAGWTEARSADGQRVAAVVVIMTVAPGSPQAVVRATAARAAQVVFRLAGQGVSARSEIVTQGKRISFQATPEALEAGPLVPVKIPTN
jgi:hypothetical protein